MSHLLFSRGALIALLLVCSNMGLSACSTPGSSGTDAKTSTANQNDELQLLDSAKERLDIYATFALNADISHLSDSQASMLPLLIEASKIMDELYWRQAYGSKNGLLSKIKDPKARRFAEINYGPWDRLDGDRPMFVQTPEKSMGAQFYPADMTKEEFEASDLPGKVGLYSLIKRENNELIVVPFHQEYAPELIKAASLLLKASTMADDPEFAEYLALRADALVTDNYQPSDFAWMEMQNTLEHAMTAIPFLSTLVV